MEICSLLVEMISLLHNYSFVPTKPPNEWNSGERYTFIEFALLSTVHTKKKNLPAPGLSVFSDSPHGLQLVCSLRESIVTLSLLLSFFVVVREICGRIVSHQGLGGWLLRHGRSKRRSQDRQKTRATTLYNEQKWFLAQWRIRCCKGDGACIGVRFESFSILLISTPFHLCTIVAF